MADIYCPICTEPWDMDCLHDEVDARWPDKPWKEIENSRIRQNVYERNHYDIVRDDFRKRGCESLGESYGTVRCTPRDAGRANMIAEIMSMSDHPDDWASDLYDLEGLF